MAAGHSDVRVVNAAVLPRAGLTPRSTSTPYTPNMAAYTVATTMSRPVTPAVVAPPVVTKPTRSTNAWITTRGQMVPVRNATAAKVKPMAVA